MIEVALGAAVAALVAKALDRAGEKAVDQGEGAARRLVDFLRKRFSGGDEEGSQAFERVEDAPDSGKRIEELARVLEERSQRDPELRRELEALVEEAEGSGVNLESLVQTTYGDQSPAFGVVSGGKVNVNYTGGSGENPPRRIS